MQWRHRRGSAVASVAITVLLAAACTPERSTSIDPDSLPTLGAASGPASEAPAGPSTVRAPGRLAVLGSTGTLSTMKADGGDRVDIMVGDGVGLVALQPSWSPDGTRIAWVIREVDETVVRFAVAVAGPRGEDPVVTQVPTSPFYLSWAPTGDRIGFLGPGDGETTSVAFGVLDVAPDGSVGEPDMDVAGGSPFFYFAWTPQGRSVVAHAGADRLEDLDLQGDGTPVSDRPGQFATPAVSSNGRTVVYVERASGIQRLVASVRGGPPKVLVEGRGTLSFVLEPGGHRIAYQFLGPQDGDFFDRRPAEPDDGVRVVDLETGAIERATRVRAMTFEWSPMGGLLLALSPDSLATGVLPFRWHVWEEGHEPLLSPSHSPSVQVLREYAPFFTQYVQSSSQWAPDGSAFAYAAVDLENVPRILIQRSDFSKGPEVVSEGVYVTWSP